jgi:hypothetical protein
VVVVDAREGRVLAGDANIMRYNITLLFFSLLTVAVSGMAQTPPVNEQVLIPFDTNIVDGADGARWSAELRVRNAADVEVNLFPDQCFSFGRPVPCELKIIVPPHVTRVLDVLNENSFPGVLLYVPLSHIDDIQFHLQVGDANSQDRLGTTIPIVRARDFRSSFTIIGVPVSAGQRRTLRVYEPHLSPVSSFRVRVVDEATNATLLDRQYERQLLTDPPFPALVPATYDFSDALEGPEVSTAQRVTVSIESVFPGLTFWPLISVTNSADHRVSIFVAD